MRLTLIRMIQAAAHVPVNKGLKVKKQTKKAYGEGN